MENISVVIVPFPAQGHLNQFLHFSLRLISSSSSSSSSSLSVHFATTESHLLQAKTRIQGWDSTSLHKIKFHPLKIPPFHSPPPNPNSDSNFPSHLIPSFRATLDLRAPLASLLQSLSATCRRLVVVHDPLVPLASHEAASLPNTESYKFQCISSFCELEFLWTSTPDSTKTNKTSKQARDVIEAQFDSVVPNELLEFTSMLDFNTSHSGTLFNSCRPVDGEFLYIIASVPQYDGKKVFAVGPLNPTHVVTKAASGHDQCLDWLDKQPVDSVLYVSFGSTCTFSDEQIEQLAIGLKCSKQRFIWVLRDADRGDICDGDEQIRQLLPGLEREIDENMGIVVRGWAPQLDILAHPATGAFMSHCGWNSCMESLSMGVPILAWPMHSDQPKNAMMLTGYLKAGIMGREWARRGEVIMGSEIKEVIGMMMVGDEGAEVRKRAKAIGQEVRTGVCQNIELEAFISHISR